MSDPLGNFWHFFAAADDLLSQVKIVRQIFPHVGPTVPEPPGRTEMYPKRTCWIAAG